MAHQIREATVDDAFAFGQRLREHDVQELTVASGLSATEALVRGVTRSVYIRAGFIDGEPLALFGVTPVERSDEVGIPWMVATDLLENPKAKPVFARESRGIVREMQRIFPLLYNLTDARNTTHHRWLKWSGFKFLRVVPIGPMRVPFYEFVRISNDV